MPIHDWTRVPAGIYHDFHGGWIYAVRGALNSGLLPKGYYALAEQTTRTFGPDVLTLQRPDASPPAANGPTKNGSHGPSVQTLTATRPKARFDTTERRVPLPKGQRKLTVRHVSDHRMVAVVELVSPGNKSSTSAFKSFVDKACAALDAGVHLLVIDPFPPGKRDPNGVHGAIWHLATRKPFTLPADKPLTLASYVAGDEITAFVNTVAVGDPLPDMALFLDPATYVSVPLEATYQAAWETFPAEWRDVVTAK
ncbi:MAG TPA: DUF4058 family protein [Gemmata sp.]|nr:DUF4058 family protein [Gemmata sp.]